MAERAWVWDNEPGMWGGVVHSVSAAHHKTIMAVDIAGYNHPSRTVAHLRVVHEGLWTVLRTTFAETGVPWAACYVENTGDGAMILLPPEIAKADLVAQLPERMLAELRRYNEVHAEGARIKLRLALNAGEVHQGSHGSVSPAISFTFRLLDALAAKAAQKLTGADLALIASDTFFHDVVKHDPAADPGSYRRMPVEVKPGEKAAWARLRLLGVRQETVAPEPPRVPRTQGDLFPGLVEALLAVPCVRDPQSRRLLLELFPRREIADVVPYHAEDRLHVIALARTCQRFNGGLPDLLTVVRTLEPESPQVEHLALMITDWPDHPES
ncbi:effector-associated domain 2-containing protein [Amycolatopsis sp. lyj-109]|uniref:effector-associated domain 2-containing protein n=1 Tax=Amycolatopsis sp. lyj-109 TaxID=2789287 RepID=UPI00397E1382